MATGTTTEKMPFREKFAYGFGDLASVLYWQTFMAYILFFYTDVFGITAAAAGTMLLLTRLWDGVNDPMMGVVADRTVTRWGRFRPYLLWLCVPFAVLGVLTFTTPDLSAGGKLVWAYVTFTLLMMLYTAINIPYSALLGVVTANPVERAQVSSIKFIFAYTAGMIVSFTLLPMAARLGGGNDQRGWQLSFVVYGIAAVAFFLIAFTFVKERIKPVAREQTPIRQDLKDLLGNRPWVILLLTTITMILFIASRLTVTAHYFKYYVGEQEVSLFGHSGTYGFEWLTSAFNGIGQIFSLVGVVFVGWFVKTLGQRRAFLTLYVVGIVACAAMYVCRPEQLALIFGLHLVFSFTTGPLSPLLWAMYADTADYGEWKYGRRATGLIFSASTMSQKFGWAIGSAFAGWLLFAVGFQANVDPTPNVQHGLRLLVSLIPAVLGGISILLMLAYPLKEDMVKTIGEELAARRNEAGEATEA
jgi:GPH family glycoside/pentoside/hexuronide:cation symporter